MESRRLKMKTVTISSDPTIYCTAANEDETKARYDDIREESSNRKPFCHVAAKPPSKTNRKSN
jgi:hypothetical protein